MNPEKKKPEEENKSPKTDDLDGDQFFDEIDKIMGIKGSMAKEIMREQTDEGKKAPIDSPEEIANAFINQHLHTQMTAEGIREGFKKLGNFPSDLQKKIILELIIRKQGYWVAKNLDKLKGLDRNVAIKLIDDDLGEYVLQNYAKFQGIDINEIATVLLEKNQWYEITNNLKSLKGLSLKIALSLIHVARKHELNSIAYHLDAFEELNVEIAQKLIESGAGEDVQRFIDLFPKEEQKKILAILAEHGYVELSE